MGGGGRVEGQSYTTLPTELVHVEREDWGEGGGLKCNHIQLHTRLLSSLSETVNWVMYSRVEVGEGVDRGAILLWDEYSSTVSFFLFYFLFIFATSKQEIEN